MSFFVSHHTAIAEIKDKILMSPHLQRLMFASIVLEYLRTMADYNITAGAVIAFTQWPYDGYNIGCNACVRYHNIHVNVAWDDRACAILDFDILGIMELTGMIGTFQVPGAAVGRRISFIYAPGPDPRSCSTHAGPHHLRIWAS